ncbi:uncharacterized protein LOC135502945 isoform X2 [Lineus longissimus]|uniref:uncharacterized protein LOC135502945 isoform X2 n=1 Tax=Lineus longissimus TaxID=88925 RepID=UPI00315CE401
MEHSEYGDVKVRVTIKRAISSGQEYKLLKLKKFLKEYKFEDWYLSTIIPQEMRKDMPFPKVLQCGTVSQYLHESQLWMSSGGTLSLLHYHGDHQFHCLLAGRKDFIFIDKKFAADFGMEKPDDFTGSSHSAMNTEMVNMYKYEKAAIAPWEWATLRPGDCVFVPAGMLHHVRSYGRSISSVSHWTPTLTADFTDCDKEKNKPQATRTLDDANLIWTFMAGKRQLSNVKLNSESLRHHFFSLLRKNDQLPYVYFETFYLTALKGVKEIELPAEVWKLIDTKKVGHLTRDELAKMPKDTLEKVAKVLNRAHEVTDKSPLLSPRDEL